MTSNSITVKANGTDNESGIAKYEFSKDNGATWISNNTNNTYTFTNLGEGSYKIKVRVTDKVGNSAISNTLTVNISENGEAILFNPETGTKCTDYVEENSNNQNKRGCMRWFAYKNYEDSSKINLLFDHNTSYIGIWDSFGSIKYGPRDLNRLIKEDTATWKSEFNARAITVDEIAKITNNSNFSSTSSGENSWFYFETNNQSLPSMSQGSATYGWLFDRTTVCVDYGCENDSNDTYSYWTVSTVYVRTDSAWAVARTGTITVHKVDSGSPYGIRPVITVDKNLIK